MPEAFVTLPTLLLAILFATFSLATTLLSFEVNPVSAAPAACSTGRVEAAWSAVRVAAVLLHLLQAHITPLASLVLFAAIQSLVLAYHLRTLPFHSHALNLFRAGVFAAVLWAAVASALVAARVAAAPHIQWVLIALAPVVFAVGAAIAHRAKLAALHTAKRLRAELSELSGSSAAGATHVRRSPSTGCLPSAGSQGSVHPRISAGAGIHTGQWGHLDAFYGVEARGGRAFDSAAGAHAAIRVLLHERDARGESIPLVLRGHE
jgi:hypothetical protein